MNTTGNHSITRTSAADRIGSFLWQHLLLLASLYLMTLGVALCIKSALGSSVISSLPLSLARASELGITPRGTVGDYTIMMNGVFVALQILILRRGFDPLQLFQLAVGWVFGWLIDLNVAITSPIACQSLWSQAAVQFAGCAVMGVGIALEVRCGSVTMPGEGITVAISRVSGMPFAKTKIMVDTTLVALAVASSYAFFGFWDWSIVGPGTLFAMLFIGYEIRLLSPHLGWFDRLLANRPGFRRYIFGLARFLYPRRH